jgi:hypothetical protein
MRSPPCRSGAASTYLYVPIERLGPALRATAAFAQPDREGTIEVQLPTAEIIPLPRLGSDPASSKVLGCRGYLELARHGTFWFPVDDVILAEEAEWFESGGGLRCRLRSAGAWNAFP